MSKLLSFVKQKALAVVHNDFVMRVVHTFWQGFLAVFVLGVPLVEHAFRVGGLATGEKALVSLGSAAGMAGLVAVRLGLVHVFQTYRQLNIVNAVLASQIGLSQPPTPPTPAVEASPPLEDTSQPVPPVSTGL